MEHGKRAIFYFVFLLLAVSAVSCSSPEVVFTDGVYLHRESGTRYVVASVSLEAMGVGEKYASGPDFSFFVIPGADPLLWLCDDEDLVYYSDTQTEPTLADFDPDGLYIGRNSDKFFALTKIEDADLITEIVSAFSSSEKTVLPASCDAVWQLKFTSARYPWLCYAVVYAEKGDKTYLYDRGTGECIDGRDILTSWIHGEEPEAKETS